MSTNYYIIKKKKLEEEKKKWELIDSINLDELKDEIKNQVIQKYKGIFDYLKENNEEGLIESFEDSLLEKLNEFENNLKYNLNDYLTLALEDCKHIGHSAAGCLFLFRYQPEWKNYKEVKDYLLTKLQENEEVIIDEYWEEKDPSKLIESIENKQEDKICKNNPDNFLYNDNVDGYRFSNSDFS